MAVLKDLIVHGASRFLGDTYFNFLKANDIAADTGYFKKLTAVEGTIDDLTSTNLTTKNATVTALLDVQGEMHTNSWSNANIATIDGSFYINPTSTSGDGSDVSAANYTPTGTITYNNSNYTKLEITGTFNTSQLSLDTASNVAWPANSYVIVTGDVLVENEWYPLGTIRGKLQSQLAANSNSKTITVIPIGATIISGEVGASSLTDGHGLKPQTLEAIRLAAPAAVAASPTTLKMRKIKVSMTSYGGTYQSPIGIYMTAMGGNKKTFLDIYGGKNDTTTIPSGSGALAEPTVRIGNLEGMPATSGITPHGWGIYTNNGFFTGTIVAQQGKIGNGSAAWTIGNSGNNAIIYTGTRGSANSAYISTGVGTESIADSGTLSGKTWVYTAGANFGVTSDGILYAKGAQLSGNVAATQGFTVTSSVGGATLASMTGNGITLGQSGSGKFNILITDSAVSNKGPGILLRQGTNVLNEIKADGMKLYLPEDPTNSIAEFGSTIELFHPGTTTAAVMISNTEANFTGTITANGGKIGGWNIGTDSNKSLYYGNQEPGATTSNLVLSPISATNTNAIAGSGTGKTWFISAGQKFGVDTSGTLYASGAKLDTITATNFSLNSGSIDSTVTIGNKAQSEYLNSNIQIGGRNKAALSYIWSRAGSTYTTNGVTFTNLGDGRFSAVGTATNAGDIWWCNADSSSYQLGKTGTFTYSIYLESGTMPANIGLQCAEADSTPTWKRNNRSDGGATTYTFSTLDGNHPYHLGFWAVAANTAINITFRLKFEEGNKSTDWAPAPEDVEAFTEDFSSAKQISAYARSFTKANWDSYGASGHSESWGASGYDNSHISVGDIAYINGSVSDKAGWYAAIIGTVTSVTASAVVMTSIKVAYNSSQAEKYITKVNDAGIRIHPSSTENNSVVINSDGMEIFKGGTTSAYSVAKYGDTARIGKETGTNTNLVATSSGINFRSGTTQFGQISAYNSTTLGNTMQNLKLASEPSANSYGRIKLSASSASGTGIPSEADLVAKKGSAEAGVYMTADQDSGGDHADVLIDGQNIALQVGYGDDYIRAMSGSGTIATLDTLGNLDITGNANITGNAFENEKRLISRNFICYANSIVRSFSSGSITMSLADLGITTGQKPVGILLTYQDGGATPTILRYDYDASSSSGVVIKAYDSSGKAVSGNVRFFALVFQNSWTSVV